MNARTRIAAAVTAGLIAGATLMGAALAAPRALTGTPFAGYRMMGSAATSAAGTPSAADMQSFMNRYRTSSGAIDMNRMHTDVTSGKVTPPCLNGANGASGTSAGPSSQTAPRGGYGMMSGTY